MDLKNWQEKISQKVEQRTYRDFLINIVSLFPLNLYKFKNLITIYPPKTSQNLNLKDTLELIDSKVLEKDYDFDQDFFSNWQNLFQNTLLPNIIDFGSNENSRFANLIYGVKNTYLSYEVSLGSENVLYSVSVKENCKNIINSAIVWDSCENVYFSNGIIKSFNIFYSKYIHNSADVWFSSNLIGCQECIFCDTLQNAKYFIRNKEYTKEEYFAQKSEILNQKAEFLERYKTIDKLGLNIGSENVSGSFVMDSQNIVDGYAVYQVRNGQNLFMVSGTKGDTNMYSCMSSGAEKCNDIYACFDCGISENIYFSQHIGFSYNIYYSYDLMGCSYCLGCVGLRNQKYCIFNKQYTETQRYELVDKIFAQMEADNILGEMYPGNLNPFYFNDTMAYIVGNFDKEEIVGQGFLRRDDEIKVDIPTGLEILNVQDLDCCTYDESILKKAIKDEHGNYYRIVNMEYEFLKKYDLPLPNLHWLDRMKLHFK